MSDKTTLDQLLKAIEKVDTKVDNIKEDMSDVKIVQAQQHEQLTIHVKRSDSLEKYVTHLEEQIAPLKRKSDNLEGVFKFFGIFAGAMASLAGIAELIRLAFFR